MRTVTPTRGFTAYPNGKKAHFPAGTPQEVSNALAETMEAKGLVDVVAKPSRGGAKAAATEPGAQSASDSDPEPAQVAD
ncbi:hypothetical protein [Aureimonas mangrovi]|uniref:hypothetical protein n=1 Tax=Aureimonas mangrovi TaxID=2758041 RepID=UPI00163D6BD7|nr:hypothetical protein [Aureimonas mangrovi]